jgi:HD-GYP domain-containing protein (c-di-GMP phosphodiesterase class II)
MENSKQSEVKFRSLAADSSHELSAADSKNENRKILYEKACQYFSQVFAAAKRREVFSLDPGYQIMRKIVDVHPSRDILFVMAIHRDDRSKFMIQHSVNVAIFAVKMGAALGFKKQQQVEIGMAALMHDVGTALIPERIINKKDPFTAEEFRIFRERPTHSYKILRSLGDNCNYLAEIAQQVYEKIDGSGYPLGLRGEEIHEHAQLVSLVDMYEAMIHSRPQREKLLSFTAVKEIIKTSKNSFRRQYLKVFLSVFSIFPIYSFVRLNSDAIGKVIETYPDQPMRPKLQIIYDSQKRRVLTERIVNLPENPLLYIVDSVAVAALQEMERQSSIASRAF